MFQFSYELRPASITATFFGQKHEGELIGPYVYQVMQHCFRLGRRSILIERHISCQITDQDAAALVRELSRPDYANHKIAYVDDRFLEKRPHDMGIDIRDYPSAPLRIFPTKPQAQSWLEGTTSSSSILTPPPPIATLPVLNYATVSDLSS